MSALQALPPTILEELYLCIPKSVPRDDIVSALVSDETRRLELEGVGANEIPNLVKAYRESLQVHGTISLAELAYELCVQNDSFDRSTNTAWLDREGKFRVNPNDIYRHLLRDSIVALSEALRGFEGTTTERRDLKKQIDSIVSRGRGVVCVGYEGELAIAFSADARQVKLAKDHPDLQRLSGHFERVKGAFGQFVDRCLPRARLEQEHMASMEI